VGKRAEGRGPGEGGGCPLGSVVVDAMKIAGIPARSLVRAVADRCGLEVRSGRIWLDGVATSLGDVEAAVRALETRLVSRPFAAPSSLELDAEGLGSRHVAAAVRAGRLMRLPDGVVLLLAPTRLYGC